MAQELAEKLTHENFITQIMDEEFLNSIYGIGEKTIENIKKFFTTKHNLNILEQLKGYGVNIDPSKYSDHLKASEAK